MKYLLQLDKTDRDGWKTFEGNTPQDAIVEAVRAEMAKGKDYRGFAFMAYVALTEHRHENGAPICVQGYTIEMQSK